MLQEKRVANVKTVMIGAVIVGLTIVSTYLGTRVHATYALATQLGQLDGRVDEHFRAHATRDKTIEDLLMQLSQTVWSPIEPQKPERRPSTVEVWQVNRDKELRARISALELQIYKLDARQTQMQRELDDVLRARTLK